MNKNFGIVLLAVLATSACTGQKNIDPADNISLMPYPQTHKGEVAEDYFGTTVEDPYRWLEDDLSSETKAWVEVQNEVTENYLAQIPYRSAIQSRLEKLWNYEKFSAPFKEGDYTYFYKNDGLQNQSVLYRQKGEDGEVGVFLDPNTFSADGTTSLAGIAFSKDGSLVAYQLSEGGSDWRKVVVIRAEDKSLVGDTLMDVKFSGLAWRGNEGFYYSSYDKPTEGSALSAMTDQHKLYFHSLNTPQSEDKLIFGGSAQPRRYIGGYLTEDEQYLVISAANATSGNELYIQDLAQTGSTIIPIVNNMEKEHYVLASDGKKLIIYTNLDAPNGKVVQTQAGAPQPSNWGDLIPEADQVLSPATAPVEARYLHIIYKMPLH